MKSISSVSVLAGIYVVVSMDPCPGGKCDQVEDEETTLLSMNIRRHDLAQPDQNNPPKHDEKYRNLYSADGDICTGIPQIDSLGAPVNPAASPNCWQIRLSEQKKRMEPRVTYNIRREKFPNNKCQRKLGSEYDIYNPQHNNVYDFTAKSMGQRMLNVAAYDTAGMCPHGNLGNPNCCNWTGSPGQKLDYAENPHLCWVWPNNIPWNGNTLVDTSFTDQDPEQPNRLLPGMMQAAGCANGTSKVPGKHGETWCDNANNFWQSGCNGVDSQLHETDCGWHPQDTMYVYNFPPFVHGPGDGSVPGSGDGSVPENAAQLLGIYAAGSSDDPVTYKKAALAPVNTKFGDGETTDGKPVARDNWNWLYKGMHGKGYACIDARVKMLDACEEETLMKKGVNTIPARYKIGIFSQTNGTGKQWPALVRSAGNRNHTIYDWHDIRVNGFAFKIYDAQDVTGEKGQNRVNIAEIPRTDYAEGAPPIKPPYGPAYAGKSYKPKGIPDAKAGFTGNLSTLENLTTVDFLFVAVRGQFQQGCMENNEKCLYNIFPAGGNGYCYSPMFLYANPPPKFGDKLDYGHCHYPGDEGPFDTHATWNPLNYTYGSSAALMLGNDGAMKMMVQPCDANTSSDGVNYWDRITNNIQNPGDPNFKANNLNQTLANSSMELCIYIQIQENPCTEPVEDATIQWMVPVRMAGRIHINKGTPARYNQVCDNTVFNPYRALTSHMPIGGLQRIRQAVYAYAANFRLYINHGKSGPPAEMSASKLPLKQPASNGSPVTPPPIPPSCPAMR